MIKLIINADDCGYSHEINEHIKHAIEVGKVTSTTIMANMRDIEGAVKLYKEYGMEVSFGVHLNLTEGSPLLKNQILLDKGIYVEKDKEISFNGSSFRNKYLNRPILEAVESEWSAQISKILDFGIVPTHIDSHHHIHTGLSFISILPKILSKYNIERFRRMRNYIPGHFGQLPRQIWTWGIQLQNRKLRATDYFGICDENLPLIKQNVDGNYTIELMCHPGGDLEEEQHLLDCQFGEHIQLISYHQI